MTEECNCDQALELKKQLEEAEFHFAEALKMIQWQASVIDRLTKP